MSENRSFHDRVVAVVAGQKVEELKARHAYLHGMNRDQARIAVVTFLAECRHHGHRCVRIVHGKGLGSRNREPVLKGRIRKLLARRSEVLAYADEPSDERLARARAAWKLAMASWSSMSSMTEMVATARP